MKTKRFVLLALLLIFILSSCASSAQKTPTPVIRCFDNSSGHHCVDVSIFPTLSPLLENVPVYVMNGVYLPIIQK